MSVFGHKMKALFRGQHQTLDAEHRVLLEANKGAIWFHAASVGEFEQARPLVDLARYLKGMRYSLMSYSGYTLEELEAKAESDSAVGELLGMIDILVDGRYEEKLRNLTLVYCGSENQRVIDMNKTREARAAGKGDEVVLYKSDFDFEIKII